MFWFCFEENQWYKIISTWKRMSHICRTWSNSTIISYCEFCFQSDDW